MRIIEKIELAERNLAARKEMSKTLNERVTNYELTLSKIKESIIESDKQILAEELKLNTLKNMVYD